MIIKNIESRNTTAALEINGKKISNDKDFRQGVTYDTDGKAMMIMWLEFRADENTQFEIKL